MSICDGCKIEVEYGIVIRTLRFCSLKCFNLKMSINEIKRPIFNKLTNIYNRLTKMKLGTFLPVYHSKEHKYSSMRFKKTLKYTKMTPNNLYKIEYAIKQTVKDDKAYVNCFLNGMKLLSKAPTIDEGTEMIFSDSD